MASTENERPEIESERETAYLLKSETMRRRLLEAKDRQGGLPLEAVIEKLNLTGRLSTTSRGGWSGIERKRFALFA
jgi:hypothetical protein